MTYDFSFDGKSLWGLLAGSAVLCALLFFAGLLVGVGWNAKPHENATAQTPAQTAQAAAHRAAAAGACPLRRPREAGVRGARLRLVCLRPARLRAAAGLRLGGL